VISNNKTEYEIFNVFEVLFKSMTLKIKKSIYMLLLGFKTISIKEVYNAIMYTPSLSTVFVCYNVPWLASLSTKPHTTC